MLWVGYNEIHGIVYGLAIQAGEITISRCPPVAGSPDRLTRALNDVTVRFSSPAGEGRGVRVGPNLVLTLKALAPKADPLLGNPDLVLVERAPDDDLYACLHAEQPVDNLLATLERVPGSPVLSRLTGAVCALVTSTGGVTPIPGLDLPPDQRWLDLLDSGQLAAGGWRHLRPALRHYLDAVRRLGVQHEYERAEDAAPDLQTIYLERLAENTTDDEESGLPDRIDADRLLTDHPNAQIVAEPGVGKSSLVRHYAAQTAATWLTDGTGAVVPVPITADAFSRGRLLPEVLADGVQSDLDLTRPHLVGLFRDEPLPGVPWLILVDGLDEVVDPALRTTVLRRIRQFRDDPKYRITLTSRHLGPADIARLDESGWPTYVLTPFDDHDLERFVSTWLDRARRPAAEAVGLVTRLRDSKLDELVYVPLIATMVCALHCSSPDAELPRDQTELYRRFVEWQLSKVSQHDLGARLRQWQARSGLSAEQAAADLRDRLEPLLRAVAFDLVQLSPKPDVLESAVRHHPGPAPEAIAAALRMSGLVVPRGQGLVFRHRTIEEYLAACHVMATHPEPHRLLEPRPSRRSEWPDLGMKVFLAAQLIGRGTDIKAQLRRHTWLVHRRHHIGFLAALVRHGVDVDERVLRRAVRVLARKVRAASTGNEWQQHVQWLHAIDPEATAEVLRSMVVRPGRHTPNRRFETVRYLIGMDPHANTKSVVTYLLQPDIRRIDRLGVSSLLAEVDVRLHTQVFSEVAIEAHEPRIRLQCAEIVLCEDTERGLDLLARLARHPSCGNEVRADAINLATDHVEAFGFDLWNQTKAWFTEYRPDDEPAPATGTLVGIETQRHQFADFLVHQAGEDPKILLETARHHEVPAELRVQAALLNHLADPARSIEVLEDVISRSAPGDRSLLPTIGHLRSIDESRGVAALIGVAEDARQDDDLRLDAAGQLPEPEALDVYDRLVDDRALSDATKVKAARRVQELDRERGLDVFRRLAGHSHVATPERMEAARRAGWRREVGYLAYESIVRDRGLADVLRVQAAAAAQRLDFRKGLELLRELQREELDGEAQLEIGAVLHRHEADMHLFTMARSSLPVEFRLAAAAKLKEIAGAKAAVKSYQAIAYDDTVDGPVRAEALREADRLRKL